MDLLILILIAFGYVTSADQVDDRYRYENQYQIDRARYVADNSFYRYRDDGGVIIDEGIDP